MKPIRAASLCLLLLTCALATQAQPTFDTAQRAAVAHNPSGLTCTLRLVGNRTTFHMGEIIPVALDFTADKAGKYILNSQVVDEWTMDLFHASPSKGVTDLLTRFHEGGGTYGGKFIMPVPIVSQPSTVPLTLNNWLRFDLPGVYHIYAVSARVWDASTDLRYLAPFTVGNPVASNIISLTILPPDPAWSHQQVLSASRHTHADMETLRYLNTQESVQALLAVLGADTYPLGYSQYDAVSLDDLYEYPDHKWLLAEMKRDLAAPDYAITGTFLDTLVGLVANQQKTKDFAAVRLAIWKEAADVAPKKTASALPTTLYTLVQAALSNRAIGNAPGTQTSLDNPALLPALRRAWAAIVWPADPGAPNDFILRRLYEMSPKEGRALILKEAASPKPSASIAVLGMLPDKTIPALDKPLAANLINGKADTETACDLIARYATPAIFPQAKSAYQGFAPQPALLAYFLRVKPAYGIAMVNAALDDGTRPNSNFSLFTDIASSHFDANLEKIAEQHLYDSDPYVIDNAAQALGKYGSAAAEAALWTRLRTPDINAGNRSDYEYHLAEALCTGQNWYMDRAKLKQVEGLCDPDVVGSNNLWDDSSSGRSSSNGIDCSLVSGGEHWDICQYQGNGSASFFAKLAQFPRGTKFSWVDETFGPREDQIFNKAEAFAKAHGMSITRWQPEANK